MAAYTYDQEKYGDQGVIMTYSPELVDMVAVAMNETAAATTTVTTTATAPAIPGVYSSDCCWLLPIRRGWCRPWRSGRTAMLRTR